MSTPGAASQQNPLVPPGFGGVPLPAGIPTTVQRAFLMWAGVVAINVVGSILLAFTEFGSVGGIIFTIIGGAVGMYFALQFRGGRGWARIVLTVFSGLAMLVSLFGIVGALVLMGLAPGFALISVVVYAGVIAGCVLALVSAWNKDSTEFFNRMAV